MNSIAKFAVKYPVTVLMFVLGIGLLGVISFGKLGTDLFPDLNNPKIFIDLRSGEKPPEEIEKNYVDQIESLSMRQSDVVQVSSVSGIGYATITVEYNWNKDMDEAFLDLQKELNTFSQNSDLEEFTISQYDPNASPVMVVALRNESVSNMDELRKISENYIRNELVRIEGVADLKVSGSEEGEVVIETSKYLLESFGLTSDAIAAQIANYSRNVSGGSIVEMGTRYVVKGVSVIENLTDLENIIVGFKQPAQAQASASQTSQARSGSSRIPVYLRDVATISYSNKEPKSYVTINGERCIGLSIYKEPEYNTVDAVNSLKKAIEDLSKALPGYEFITVADQGRYINSAVGEVKGTLVLGIILAVIILYVFLRRIGTTLVISLAIPISIVATFNLMYFNGLSLNIMTLGGLALGAGMLVDNAIVVLENVTRLREEGLLLTESIIKGTGQVGGAITASTLTTIVVFLPVVYLHDASSALFRDQAWTVTFALLSSLVVAMLVIPMLLAVMNREKEPGTHIQPARSGLAWYKAFLEKVLEKRVMVLVLSVILLALTSLLLPKIGSEFMPRSESAEFTINLTLPEGSGIKRTISTASESEGLIRDLIGDKLLLIYAQSGAESNNNSGGNNEKKGENNASLKVFLKPEFSEQTEAVIGLIESYLKAIPETEITFTREESALQSVLGTTGAPFALEISGEDTRELERLVSEARSILEANPGLYNLYTSLDKGTPEVEIRIDRFRSSYFGVSSESISSQVSSYLEGSQAGKFEKDGELRDITVKLEKISVNQLSDLLITAGSVKVPLSELARIEIVNSPGEITRKNQSRTAYVYGMVRKDITFDKIIRSADEALKSLVLPANYKMEFAGEEIRRKETVTNLSFALILSLVLVFMVLAAQFESLIQPFIVMLTIPLAGIGTILTFYLLSKPLNMMAYIGIIMLGGIAVNNAILLIDRINQLRAHGTNRRDAIILAGTQRIRPILMTSLTTILALVPLTFGIGESASLRAPMALAVIGGMVSSTLLTLVVIPCVYWFVDSFSEWIRKGKSQTVQN